MQFKTDLLSIEKMNNSQRKGVFAALTLAAIVLFLHFPFDGYTVRHEVITRYGKGECPYLSIEKLKEIDMRQLEKNFEQDKLCRSESELQLRPFQDWASDAPIVGWFGSVFHTLITLLFLCGLCFAWISFSKEVGQNK